MPKHRNSGGQAGNPNSLANLKSGPQPKNSLPPPSPTDAADYVKLRAAGLPGKDAMRLFIPRGVTRSRNQCVRWSNEWDNHPHVVTAWREFQGGDWQDLPEQDRLERALSHHLAQLAYYLLTSNWNAAAADTKKINDAREAILAKLSLDKGGDGGRFDVWMRSLVDGKAELSGPPIMRLAAAEVTLPFAKAAAKED